MVQELTSCWGEWHGHSPVALWSKTTELKETGERKLTVVSFAGSRESKGVEISRVLAGSKLRIKFWCSNSLRFSRVWAPTARLKLLIQIPKQRSEETQTNQTKDCFFLTQWIHPLSLTFTLFHKHLTQIQDVLFPEPFLSFQQFGLHTQTDPYP